MENFDFVFDLFGLLSFLGFFRLRRFGGGRCQLLLLVPLLSDVLEHGFELVLLYEFLQTVVFQRIGSEAKFDDGHSLFR